MSVLKKLGILSVAKLQALIMAIMGLIGGIFIALFGSVMSAFSAAGGSDMGMVGFAGLGLAAIIVLPIVYGIGGFIGGAVGAWIYNLIAGWIGGIEMEFEEKK